MKRLRRIIFNALTLLSLLLCVATIVLWGRSYRIQDRLHTIGGGITPANAYHRVMYDICSVQGVNVFQMFAQDVTSYPEEFLQRDVKSGFTKLSWSHVSPRQYSFNYNPDVRNRPLLYRLGLRFSHRIEDSSPSIGYTEIRFPDWLLALLTAILPTAWLARLYQRRRLARVGLCPVCNYDLRATPDRCPECGAVTVSRGCSSEKVESVTRTGC
jgi:hypothetical protein